MKTPQKRKPKAGRGYPRPIVVAPRPRAALSKGARLLLETFERRGAAGDVRLRELREVLGVSVSTLSGFCRELQEAGFVRITRRGQNLPNAYELTEPATIAA